MIFFFFCLPKEKRVVLNSGGHQHLVSCLETLQKALKGWCVLCALHRMEIPWKCSIQTTQGVAAVFTLFLVLRDSSHTELSARQDSQAVLLLLGK